MKPANTYTDGFRFEKDELAKAYFYDVGQSGDARWKTNYVTLAHATQLALNAATLLFSSFVFLQ